jgi:hypothetical protein
MPFSSSGRDHTLINAACIFLSRSSYNRNRLTLSAFSHRTSLPATLLSSHPVILTMRAADFADSLMLIARLRAPPAPV